MKEITEKEYEARRYGRQSLRHIPWDNIEVGMRFDYSIGYSKGKFTYYAFEQYKVIYKNDKIFFLESIDNCTNHRSVWLSEFSEERNETAKQVGSYNGLSNYHFVE